LRYGSIPYHPYYVKSPNSFSCSPQSPDFHLPPQQYKQAAKVKLSHEGGNGSEGRTPRFLKGKGKAVPLQAWSGPEGSRNLRFPDFMTTAQNGGKVVSFTYRPPLTP